MRIWNINPKLMCRQHLLGEHAECHSILSILDNGNEKARAWLARLVEHGHVGGNVASRHDELAAEMLRRGYEHNSPVSPSVTIARDIDVGANLSELMSKCEGCYARLTERVAERAANLMVLSVLGIKPSEEIEREVVC